MVKIREVIAMYSFLLSVAIDTPTNDFYGSAAPAEFENAFFNTPQFFVGVCVGIISYILVKKIYAKIKKIWNSKNAKQNEDKKDK